MPTQTEAGKAFEYALIKQTFDFFISNQIVVVNEDGALQNVRNCFNLFGQEEQLKYINAANAAIKHISELEPGLGNTVLPNEQLDLKIVSDIEGTKGDVRDIIFSRFSHNWEVGISAKNNHRAVKHSRLSESIDFGRDWLGLKCSDSYFSIIGPIFAELRGLKKENELWRNLANKHRRFYIPILDAFRNELLRLDKKNPAHVPGSLLSYLIGNNDFYKVIKRVNRTEIYGFHLHGTLNKSIGKIKPKFTVPRLKLPTRIIELSFKQNSTDTIILTCDEGWQISFRIHNASSKVEPSLKFDINLIGQPQSLYSHHLNW